MLMSSRSMMSYKPHGLSFPIASLDLPLAIGYGSGLSATTLT
jgi:hypothetical protein